jgi:hypothetical protein
MWSWHYVELALCGAGTMWSWHYVELALSSKVKLNCEKRNRCDVYHSFEMHYRIGEDTDITIQTKSLRK